MADDATAPTTVPVLVTVPNVELCMVGEDWPASTGPCTITAEDLVAAVAAQDDPGIRTPVLKIGHSDPRFDGQPSIGRIENLRTDENGTVLVGDLTGVPAWIADIMGSAWPSRSVEFYNQYKSGTGRTHDMVLTGLALLGVQTPAIETLADVAALYQVAAAHERATGRKVVLSMPANALAGVQTEDVRRAYYDTLESGQYWWWIRAMYVDPMELIVDDDEGGLWRVPYSVDTAGAVTFGEATQVVIEYVDKPQAASRTTRRTVVAYANRQQARPGQGERKVSMAFDQNAALRTLLGLEPDASDEDVQAALEQRENDEPDEEVTTTGDQTEEETEDSGETVAPASPAEVPEGAVLVDASAWSQVQRDAAAGRQARQEQVSAERTSYLDTAQREGRITRASRANWAAQLALGGEAERLARQTVASFPKNTAVPVEELGHATDDAVNGLAGSDYPENWLTPNERARVAAARGTER